MPLAHTVHEITLQNGARGILVDVPMTTAVSYEFHFRAGNDYARDPSVQQTAHILEHLAFGANARFATAEAFSQEFGRNGAYSNATTWDIGVSYYGGSALMELERILDLWQLSLTQPQFSEETLRTEKSNVREELEGQLSNHPRVLAQHVNRAMGGHSFMDQEKISTIDTVTLADIEEHYTRTHVLRNLRFVISGAIGDKLEVITKKLESWDLPTGERLSIKPDHVQRGELTHIYREDMPTFFFQFSMGLRRRLSEEEADAMSALNHMLNGTFHSRIFGKARTRGLCYGVGSSTSTSYDGTSEWGFSGRVSSRNATALFELIVNELRAVARGEVSDQEVAEAKSYALGKLQLRAQTADDLGDEYSSYIFNDEPIILLDQNPAMIEALNRDDITRLAREFIEAGHWVFGELGAIEIEDTRAHEKIMARLFETQ